MAAYSGYQASLSIGSYAGADITNISVTINGEPIDVTCLADTWKKNVNGLRDWEVTGTKNFTTQDFLTALNSGRTSVLVTITSPAGATVFSGLGFCTRGVTTFPMGAATEEITVVGQGSTPSVTA